MAIEKINFNETLYGVSFEQLDINGDEIIDQKDLAATQDTQLKTTIEKVLNDSDEEIEVTINTTNDKTKTADDNGTKSIETLTAQKAQNTKKITALKTSLNSNTKEIEELDYQITTLSKEIKNDIEETNTEIAKIIKEKEEQFQKTIDDAIYEAKNQKTEDGKEPKSFSDILSEKMSSDLDISGDILAATTSLVLASSKVTVIDSLITKTKTLNEKNIEINTEVKTLTAENANIDTEIQELEEKAKAAQEAETATRKGHDPQGFQTVDANGNTVQYDFFIDKDGNKDLSNENEFLGAEGGKTNQAAAWAEMTKLDTSKDGKVDIKELSAANVMVVKTVINKDGTKTQEAMSIEDAFGTNSDLKIDTIQHNTAKTNVGPFNFNQDDEKQNELWGTFDVTLNNQTLIGYQTNDSLDWLKTNYNFSDYKTSDNSTFANTFKVAKNIEEYQKDVTEINNLVKKTWSDLGISEDKYNIFTTYMEEIGKLEGDNIIKKLKTKADEEKAAQTKNDDEKKKKQENEI